MRRAPTSGGCPHIPFWPRSMRRALSSGYMGSGSSPSHHGPFALQDHQGGGVRLGSRRQVSAQKVEGEQRWEQPRMCGKGRGQERREGCAQASTQGSSGGEGTWVFLWDVHCPADLSLPSSIEAPEDFCPTGRGAKGVRGLFPSDSCLAVSQCLKSPHLWEDL